jgi:hypothetical protein
MVGGGWWLWWGECGGKRKKKDTRMTWFDSRIAILSPATVLESLMVFVNSNRLIHKHTDTIVASPGVFLGIDFHGEREVY